MTDSKDKNIVGTPDYYGTGGAVKGWLDQNIQSYLESNPGLIQAKAILGGPAAGFCPTGTVVDFAGAAAPSGWVLCDGSTYDGTNPVYLNLWSVIGVTYGGSGQSSFIVPDARGRAAIGIGTNAAVDVLGDSDGLAVGSRTPKATVTAAGTVGSEATHTHGAGSYQINIPSTFDASGTATNHTSSGVISVTGTSGAGSSHTHTFTGSGVSINPGFITLTKIIKL